MSNRTITYNVTLEKTALVIRRLRMERQMSYGALGTALGIDPLIVIDFERGAEIPTKKQLKKMAKIFGVDVKDLEG